MKKLYTSYFNRMGRDTKAVVISCTFPKWLPPSEFQGSKREDLAPIWWMVDKVNEGNITTEEYNQLYMHLITVERKLTAEWIVNSLDEGSILICYEKIGKPCHRRTLASWLESETGIVIPEWLNPDELEEQRLRREKNQLVDSLLNF